MSAYSVEVNPPSCGTAGMILVAARIALKYQHGTPSAKQLMRDYGMSQATAYRWRNAFKVARGEA